jgi:hypothetical protein
MADMTGEQMQAKITAARREAEGLKDKIKRRKDELADSSRTILPALSDTGTVFRATQPPLMGFPREAVLTSCLQFAGSRRTKPTPSPELA